jgi:hypothetical protein
MEWVKLSFFKEQFIFTIKHHYENIGYSHQNAKVNFSELLHDQLLNNINLNPMFTVEQVEHTANYNEQHCKYDIEEIRATSRIGSKG